MPFFPSDDLELVQFIFKEWKPLAAERWLLEWPPCPPGGQVALLVIAPAFGLFVWRATWNYWQQQNSKPSQLCTERRLT